MAKYRKKPVVIEARQLTEQADWDAIAEWCHGDILNTDHGVPGAEPDSFMEIVTLEGVMRADLDDWIIKGVAGEFYSCKPGIFAATYEPVMEPIYADK